MSILFMLLTGAWGAAFVAASIWQIVQSFRCSVGLTLGSFVCGIFGLILLSKHWDALKYSFAATLLSLIGALASGVAWQVSLDADFAESVAAAAGSTGAP